MYSRLLSILAFALVVPTMGATTNGVTFKIRQENGVDQYYRLEVPLATGKARHWQDLAESSGYHCGRMGRRFGDNWWSDESGSQ